MQKKILKALLPQFQRLYRDGVSVMRTQKAGARGEVTAPDRWQFKDDRLFPSTRCDAQEPHINKDSAVKAIVRARHTFQAPPGCEAVDVASIRSHSGRHRFINDMKNASVDRRVGMTYGRIDEGPSYDGYGAVTHSQAGHVLDSNAALSLVFAKMYESDNED